MAKQPKQPQRPSRPLLSPGSWPEAQRLKQLLRDETFGGLLLLGAALAALIWTNTPAAASYFAFRDTRLGPAALHLDLTIGLWAADGLLAIFFFMAGMELKHEFVAGDLRDPRQAAVPIAAAVGGMIMPALLYVAINSGNAGALRGWAIPTATDIAFSLAVLAIVSTHLPSAMRTFLLTLAIVDDLLAIMVIAAFYTSTLHIGYLLLALLPLLAFTVLVQLRITSGFLLIPLAVLTWALVHASGIHATVAGVLLGFAVPVLRSTRRPDGRLGRPGLQHRFERRWGPISAGFAVPVFAFLAAGVTITSVGEAVSNTITQGIAVGLVVGKPLGIMAGVFLVATFTRASLAPGLSWWDVLGLSVLAGIGFTVSLLIGELAFGVGTSNESAVKIGVVFGSLIAAVVAVLLLRIRNRVYKKLVDDEQVDSDDDGVPDVYQRQH